MFTSISRGRPKYRTTYICTSCLAYISPHPDPQSAIRVSNREPFSTTSFYHESDKNDAGNAIDKRKRRRGRPPTAQPISHSKDTLAALKESLVAEQTTPKESISKPKPKPKPNTNPNASTEIIKSTKPGSTYPGAWAKTVKANKASRGKDLKLDNASPSADGKAGTDGKRVTVKKEKPITKPMKLRDTTKSSPKDTRIPAETLAELAKVLPRPTKRLKAKQLTDAQRQKVDAVLLGAKNKRLAALSKKIISHIHSIGENETREALVKIIEDGKLPKSDTGKPIRKILSHLRVRGMISKARPTIRATFPELPPMAPPRSPPPPVVTRSLREALQEAHFKRPPVPKRLSPSRTPTRTRKPRPVSPGPLTGKAGFEIKTLDAADLELTPIIKAQPPVPSLSYGLDRVLFNPGVYHLQDPRSRVFNFDPYLQTIMPVDEFDFSALKRYITSSRDEALLAVAKEEKKKYTGSTSSMTAALAHFHFLLSQWRPINTEILSQNFPVEYHTFTALQRGPSAVFLKWKDGVYAIDADKQFDTANILSTLGKSMEKLLTLPTKDFEKYRKENSDQIPLEEREAAEPFNYTTIGDFLLRSQLDAYDPRLPGTGMFDLKTRAVVSIRMDVSKYEQGRDYEIRKRYGEYESFEREYYDMIRAAFLKYSLQVRMGRMDGIFVAFHNTQRIFGFQYISQPEMDLALHGTEDNTIGDAEFKLSLELLNKVLDKASAKYPEKSLRMHFETRDTDVPFMYIFAEPMEDEQIVDIQESNKAVIEEFEKRVLGLESEGTEEMEEPEEKLPEEDRKAAEWLSMRAQVEETMEKDELDLEEARGLAESMIDESDIFGSEAISAEEKERLINDLLESSAFSEMEDEEAMDSREDKDSREDGVEGASADPSGDMEEDEDDVGQEDEEATEDEDEANEEDGDNEEDLEEQEEVGGEEEIDQEGEEAEETGDLKQTEDQGLLADEAPADDITEEPEVEVFDAPARPPESVESIEDSHSETITETTDVTNTESAEPDIVENKELAPDEAAIDSDAQHSDPASEGAASETIDPETEDPNPASNAAEGSVTDDTVHRNQTDVLAMTLTIRNKVNGKYVDRPKKLTSNDKWTIEYALQDVNPQRAGLLYQACKTRRAKTLNSVRRDDSDNPWNARFMQNLWSLSQKGKKWRERQNKIDSEGPLKVLELENMKTDKDSWGTKEKEESYQTASDKV
jgi:hypothetical protein